MPTYVGFFMQRQFIFFVTFFTSLFSVELLGQAKPFWVTNNTVQNSQQYYFGIGISDSSFDDADFKARIQFSMNVEVKVKSLFEQKIKEDDNEYSNTTKVSNELLSDVSLKGIAVTERFHDSLFYSLILYKKDDYDSLIAQEIRREIERQKVKNKMEEERKREEIRAERAKDSLTAVQQNEKLKTQQEQSALEAKQYEQEEFEKQFRIKQYQEFLSQSPPEKVVTLRNGELSHASTSIGIKTSVSPFVVRGAYVAFRLWKFEFSSRAVWQHSKVEQQEAFAKIQILPNIGDYYRTTLAIGVSQALGRIAENGYFFDKSKYSFFISGNVTLAHFMHSYISFYGDRRNYAVGINSNPFYSLFKHHVGVMIDLHYIPDEEFRNLYGDPIMVQGGIRLEASETMSTVFAYEGNERFFLTFEFAF